MDLIKWLVKWGCVAVLAYIALPLISAIALILYMLFSVMVTIPLIFVVLATSIF